MTETSSTSAMSKPDRGRGGDRRPERRRSPLGRMGLFYRQIIAELRKVIWPTRKELITYTTVALTFIVIMIGIVTVLDYGFTKLVFAVLG